MLAKDLMNRSLIQLRGGEYFVHDVLLDFAKAKLKTEKETLKATISSQARYLGDLNVLQTYSDKGEVDRGFHALIALWRTLEDLSEDGLLEVNTYKTSLGSLRHGESASDVAGTTAALATLFRLQVGLELQLLPVNLANVPAGTLVLDSCHDSHVSVCQTPAVLAVITCA